MASITFTNNSDIGIGFLTHRNTSICVMSDTSFVMKLDPITDDFSLDSLKAYYDHLMEVLDAALSLGGKLTVAYDLPSDWGSQAGVSDMIGARPGANGVKGLVPAPSAGDETKGLLGDGTWGNVATFDSDMVAPRELSHVASIDYSVGDQFIYMDNLLYEAVAPISAGDSIMPVSGSDPGNCVCVGSVVSQLKPFVGATAFKAGKAGLVPQSLPQYKDRLLGGDGTWKRGRFVGTRDQWEALTVQEKIQYETAEILLDELVLDGD